MDNKLLKIALFAAVAAAVIVIVLKALGVENSAAIGGGIGGGIAGALAGSFSKKKKSQE